jgi:DNA-directed RNA polymerase subunit RPC12/RpoP
MAIRRKCINCGNYFTIWTRNTSKIKFCEECGGYRLLEGMKCYICGISDLRVLNRHHIDNDHKNNNSSNVIIVCANCHRVIHGGLAGKFLTTREDIEGLKTVYLTYRAYPNYEPERDDWRVENYQREKRFRRKQLIELWVRLIQRKKLFNEHKELLDIMTRWEREEEFYLKEQTTRACLDDIQIQSLVDYTRTRGDKS